LTGTPVQNNLRELYSLLHFVAPAIFRLKYVDDFIEEFRRITDGSAAAKRLQDSLHKVCIYFL
jgi:SNF2 family DNA or RNA helicase